MANDAALLAGLALGAALNVKLIPLLLVLPLATAARSWQSFGRYALGGFFGCLPYLVALLAFSTTERQSFLHNVFGYRSFPEYWGIELIVRTVVTATHDGLSGLADSARHLGDWYLRKGGRVLLSLSMLFSAWQVSTVRWRLDAYRLTSVVFAGFLLLASGFGVQYVGCVVAPLLACTIRGGLVASTLLGLLILAIYVDFVVVWSPVFSSHGPFPADFSGLSALAWVALLLVVVRLFGTAAPASERQPVSTS